MLAAAIGGAAAQDRADRYPGVTGTISPAASTQGGTQEWSGESGASGHPLMTAAAIRQAADLPGSLSVRATDEACVYLEHPLFADRPGIYGPPERMEQDYSDNPLRFALLSRAALASLARGREGIARLTPVNHGDFPL